MRGFWSEVKVFLRESWELFYWSLWWPSKLEGRIGELSFSSVIVPYQVHTSPRIIGQFFFLISLLCTPLAISIAHQGRSIDLLFLSSMPFIAYGVAVWFFPAAFAVPIISTIVYSQQPNFWQTGFSMALKFLLPIPVLLIWIGVGVMGLAITKWIVNRLCLLDFSIPDYLNS
jgi:hypothetical protein